MALSLPPKASVFTWSPVNIFWPVPKEICCLIATPKITLFKEIYIPVYIGSWKHPQIFNLYECIKVTLTEQKHNKVYYLCIHWRLLYNAYSFTELYVTKCSNEEGTIVELVLMVHELFNNNNLTIILFNFSSFKGQKIIHLLIMCCLICNKHYIARLWPNLSLIPDRQQALVSVWQQRRNMAFLASAAPSLTPILICLINKDGSLGGLWMR